MAAKKFDICVLDEMAKLTSADRDKAMAALAAGIYTYLTNVDNIASSSVVTATGTVTPPVPPVIYAGATAYTLTWPPADTIKGLLLTNSAAALVAGDCSFLFKTLMALPVVVTVTGWEPSSVGALSGAGTCVFAALAPLALPTSPAVLDMQATKPTSKEAAWELLAGWVVKGLTGGAVVVAACGGTVGTTTFVGAGAGAVNYQ